MREQGKVLEHQADAAPIRRHRPAGSRHHFAIDAHGAAMNRLDAGGNAQSGGFAGAGFAQEANDLAGPQGRG
jgi:hypothetical protein